MPDMYKAAAEFAQTWGLIYFLIVFALALGYAFWPDSKDRFENAARLPLRED
jgi:cytochrome c oxidase cbb3-type subunit 4